MKTRYKIIYKEHGSSEWADRILNTHAQVMKAKDHLIDNYIASDIKIFETVDNRCVFNAVDLIDYNTAVEDVERINPHIF